MVQDTGKRQRIAPPESALSNSVFVGLRSSVELRPN
jgi:hypothetical protein